MIKFWVSLENERQGDKFGRSPASSTQAYATLKANGTARKYVRLGVPFTRNNANRRKIWTASRSKIWTLKSRSNFWPVQSKIWTARCVYGDWQIFVQQRRGCMDAWLLSCKTRKIANRNCEYGFTSRVITRFAWKYYHSNNSVWTAPKHSERFRLNRASGKIFRPVLCEGSPCLLPVIFTEQLGIIGKKVWNNKKSSLFLSDVFIGVAVVES